MAFPTESESAKAPSLAWGSHPGEGSGVESIVQMDKLLDHLHQIAAAGQPFIVELVVPRAGTLAIGLGLDDTVLSYAPSTGDPPYLRSAGSSEGSDLVFRYYGEWTEFPREYSVPLGQGRDAMRVFFEEGALSRAVKWVEV